jgi:uncharacterized FAD-dependent dehydrogenase
MILRKIDCLQQELKQLRSEVRHLGTEVNLKVLESITLEMKGHMITIQNQQLLIYLVEDGQVSWCYHRSKRNDFG